MTLDFLRFSSLLLMSAMSLSVFSGTAQAAGPHSDDKDAIVYSRPEPVRITEEDERRAAELVARMTLDEKIDYISGVRSFLLRPVPRLGIPEIRLADGPQGIRNNTKSTLYPCGILTAATWNRDLALALGHGLGQDAKARGVAILLGPGVNIYRAPLCGRNYEYMGEDPYLASETAKEYILGVQAEGVMATVKHFAANNQLEHMRHSASSDVDERTLNEIYFPAFRKAVQEAGVGSVMDSYNLVWGLHSTENPWLNIEVLRNRWGFKGIVMSDWTSVYSTSGAANGGLDLECPVGVYFTKEKLMPLIESGVVEERTIDEKVKHILQTFIAFGFLDRPMQDTTIALDNPVSGRIAREIAEEGIVLLKNEGGNLPLKKRSRVLVMGPNADRIPTGGGSGFVTPYSTVSVYQGLCSELGERNVMLLTEDMLYADMLGGSVFTDSTCTVPGFNAEYYCNTQLSGEPFKTCVEGNPTHYWKYGSPFEGMPEDKYSVRWTGVLKPQGSGLVRFSVSGDDGYRLYVDGKLLGGDWGNHSLTSRSLFLEVEAGKTYSLRYEFYDNAGEGTVTFAAGLRNMDLLEENLEKAASVVYCGGFDSSSEGEGWERPFAIPEDQRNMITLVSDLHENVTVVMNAGGGVDFNGWSEGVESVIMAWYPGQEGGSAVASVLTGEVCPSGRLPISIEDRWEDNPAHESYYDVKKRVTYTEGIFGGYRGYDRTGKVPRYPFGYGLSYTSFAYKNISAEKTGENTVTVSFDITNTGKCAGKEVAQVYVRDVESSVVRQSKELKGYQKVEIRPGETVRVSVTLGPDAFAYYDIFEKDFVVEPGKFEILAGHSSAELPLSVSVEL